MRGGLPKGDLLRDYKRSYTVLSGVRLHQRAWFSYLDCIKHEMMVLIVGLWIEYGIH